MAFYRLYIKSDTFQILSSQGRDLLDAAKLADASGDKEAAAANRKAASEIEQKIGAMLEENAERAKQASVSGKPNDVSNPFPEWVRALIIKFGSGKAKFDRMNAEYKVRTDAEDEDESDDEYAMFKAEMEKASNESPERRSWYTANPIQVSTTFEDEKTAMDELEKYLGGNPDAATKKRR